MLSKQLQEIYQHIVTQSLEMVSQHVERKDLTGKVDYASIYAQSEEDYIAIESKLKRAGVIEIASIEGNYYRLNTPLETVAGSVSFCRVRKPDQEHPQLGYLDFEATDYPKFKVAYLESPHFSLLSSGDVEMVELFDPSYNVRAYFPDEM